MSKRARSASYATAARKLRRIADEPEVFPFQALLLELQQVVALNLPIRDLGVLLRATLMIKKNPLAQTQIMQELCRREWRSPIPEQAVDAQGRPRYYRMYYRFQAIWAAYTERHPMVEEKATARFWTRAYFVGSRTVRLVLTLFVRQTMLRLQPSDEMIREVAGFDLGDSTFPAEEWHWSEWRSWTTHRGRNMRQVDLARYRSASLSEFTRDFDVSAHNWLTVGGSDQRRTMMRGLAAEAIPLTNKSASATFELSTNTERPHSAIALPGDQPRYYTIGEKEVSAHYWTVTLDIAADDGRLSVQFFCHPLTRRLVLGTIDLHVVSLPRSGAKPVVLRAGPDRHLRLDDGRTLLTMELYGAWDYRRFNDEFTVRVEPFVTAIDLDVLVDLLSRLGNAGTTVRSLLALGYTGGRIDVRGNPPGEMHAELWQAWLEEVFNAETAHVAQHDYLPDMVASSLGGIIAALASDEELRTMDIGAFVDRLLSDERAGPLVSFQAAGTF